MSVTWTTHAYQTLLDLMNAHDPVRRKTIYDFAKFVCGELTHYPYVLGESRDPNIRLWFAGLLTVLYQIEPNQDVIVQAIRLSDKDWPEYPP